MMRRGLWAVVAIAVVGVMVWVGGSASEEPAEPVDVMATEDEPEVEERPAPSAAAVDRAAAEAPAPRASDRIPVAVADRRVASATTPTKARPGASLVQRAWDERKSREAFDGPPKFTPNRAGIQGAIRASLPELKNCYEAWTKMQPDLGGRIVMSFDIAEAEEGATDAKVKNVKVKSSELEHTFMEGCVQSVMADLRFEPPDGGKMSVNYPLVFAQKDE